MMMPLRGRRRALPLTPRPKRVGQLRDREDALLAVMLDLLLRHASQETEMILAHGLVVTTLAELANLAVRVEDERWWRHRLGHLLHIAQTLVRPSQFRRQTHLRGLAGLAMPDDPAIRDPSLQPGEEYTVECEQKPLFFPDLTPLSKQHWDIVKRSQGRHTRHLLESVEGKAEGPIFHTGFQHDERPVSQNRRGQEHPSYDVVLVVLREYFGHSLASYLVSRLREAQRVIRQ